MFLKRLQTANHEILELLFWYYPTILTFLSLNMYLKKKPSVLLDVNTAQKYLRGCKPLLLFSKTLHTDMANLLGQELVLYVLGLLPCLIEAKLHCTELWDV